MPLILKGQAKKVIAISSGHAALDMVRQLDLDIDTPYAISKIGLNMAIAKFSTQYKKDGVLFLSICPGSVDTGYIPLSKNNFFLLSEHGSLSNIFFAVPPEVMPALGALMAKFQGYAPNFKGPATPEAAVKDVTAVWKKKSVENGDSGDFVSHFGNQQWL